jgi:superfamily I DNA/RNA helicase
MISRGELAHQLIRASAGTGKTYQLSNRFLTLLVGGVPLDQILATTFTRKAAGEILERVMLRLAGGRPRGLPRVGRRDRLPSLSRPRCRLLAQITASCTVCGQHPGRFFALARSFSPSSLPPGWRIVDELEDRVLQDQAIRRAVR